MSTQFTPLRLEIPRSVSTTATAPVANPSAVTSGAAVEKESAVKVESGSDKPKAAVDSKELDSLVKNLNDYIQQFRRELQFVVDKDSGRTVVKVVDSETHEVIRQIPPDEMLALARRMSEASGMILKAEA